MPQHHTEPYKAIQGTAHDLTWLWMAVQAHIGPWKTIQGHTRPYRAKQDHIGPYKTIPDYTGPYDQTKVNRAKCLWVPQGSVRQYNPHIYWATYAAKNILDNQNYWSKMLESIVVQKRFEVNRNFGSKKLWVKKKFDQKNWCLTNLNVQKNVGSKQIVCLPRVNFYVFWCLEWKNKAIISEFWKILSCSCF